MALAAWFFPADLGPAPIEAETGVKPPWVFLSIYGVENLLGKRAILYSLGILFGFLLLVPFVDRVEKRHPADRKIMIAFGILLLLVILIFSVYAMVAAPEIHED